MVVRHRPHPETGQPGQWVEETHTRLGLDWARMRAWHWLGRVWFWLTLPVVLADALLDAVIEGVVMAIWRGVVHAIAETERSEERQRRLRERPPPPAPMRRRMPTPPPVDPNCPPCERWATQPHPPRMPSPGPGERCLK